MNYRNLIIVVSSIIGYTTMSAMLGEHTFFSTRSQSVNAALELVGWEQEINQADMTTCYGTAALAIDYTHSFHTKQISKFLFSSQCLKVPDRKPHDILADYIQKKETYYERF